MRVLTAEEVEFLEEGLLPRDMDCGPWDEARRPRLLDLTLSGLLSFDEDEHFLHMQTTPRGRLALRCHRAYLESGGGR